MKQPRLTVTRQAKSRAKKGLLSDSGLTLQQARKQGITSGRARAQQLIANQSISYQDAKRVAAFYQRFKNCKTRRCENAINLWGGRAFGKAAMKHTRKH